MKKSLLVSLISIASTAVVASAADPDPAASPTELKNLARHHLGANLFLYSEDSQAYLPTQASSSWLDDDISTGMSPMPGKQDYLLTLPQVEALNNFTVSARPAEGTVTLYVSDTLAPPTAKSWTLVAKDVPFNSLNGRQTGQAFTKTGRYVLIETNLNDPLPIYSLNLYGNKPASDYTIRTRDQAIDPRAAFGPWVNDSLTFNVTSLYAQASVRNPDGSANVAAQAALDDNPETGVTLGGSAGTTELPVTLAQSQNLSRIAIKTSPGAKGRFDFFLTDGAAATPGTTPTASITLDGSESRASVDFPGTKASTVLARWTPANGSDSVSLTDLNAFAGNSLATYAVASVGGDTVAASGHEADSDTASTHSRRHGTAGDGKDLADAKSDPKDAAPIAALDAGPYLPGALGFPPNFGVPSRHLPPGTPPTLVPPLPPTQPVSP